jgi:hypothetical protein
VGDIGFTLYGVWHADPTHVYAVGSNGGVWHNEGSGWQMVGYPPPTVSTLRAIWGVDATHYWVVGEYGTAWAFDGAEWVSHPLSYMGSPTYPNESVGTLTGIWGTSMTDVYVTNSTGAASANTHVVHHYTGSWTPAANAWTYATEAIWGASGDDIWAVGYTKGAALHAVNGNWSGVSTGSSGYLRGVWGADASGVWAVGDNGQVLFWNGSAWSSCLSPTTSALHGVHGAGDAVWAVGQGGALLEKN